MSLPVRSIVASFALTGAAIAQEPFYKNKQLRVIISTGVGGGYNEYARTLEHYLPRHIAGAPQILVQSMPGAGGLLAMNTLYNLAPKDGTTIGLVHSTTPLAPLWTTQGARYDTQKFNWLAALDRADGVCTVWHTADVKTFEDLLRKPMTSGTMGAGSETGLYPTFLNTRLGAKIKIIGGYKNGSEIDFAMERREIDARCGTHLQTYKALHPAWMREKWINVPVVVGDRRIVDYPDAPAVLEYIKDPGIRQELELLMVSQTYNRPMMAPPGTPAERVAELRKGLAATFADPDFRGELEKRNLTLDPVPGEELAGAFARAYSYPKTVVDAVRDMMAASN